MTPPLLPLTPGADGSSATSGLSSRTWYYAHAGAQYGAFADDVFRAMVRDGTVSTEDLVWTEGFRQWVPLTGLSGFLEATSTPSPPPLPQPENSSAHSGQHKESQIPAAGIGSGVAGEVITSKAPSTGLSDPVAARTSEFWKPSPETQSMLRVYMVVFILGVVAWFAIPYGIRQWRQPALTEADMQAAQTALGQLMPKERFGHTSTFQLMAMLGGKNIQSSYDSDGLISEIIYAEGTNERIYGFSGVPMTLQREGITMNMPTEEEAQRLFFAMRAVWAKQHGKPDGTSSLSEEADGIYRAEWETSIEDEVMMCQHFLIHHWDKTVQFGNIYISHEHDLKGYHKGI